jgi:signal transduction histidine kinase
VAPRDLLDQRLEAWRGRAPDRELRRRAASGLPLVLVDPAWLGKALDELLDNATKYTPAGSPITLLAGPSPEGDRVRLSVRDAGPGLDAADHDLVFTSFEQKDGSATRRVGGLGLGLSFVRRVAQDAGWVLSVTSAPGRGAQFSLDLPVAGEDPAQAAPTARSGRRASPAAPRRARAPGPGPSPARRPRPRRAP